MSFVWRHFWRTKSLEERLIRNQTVHFKPNLTNVIKKQSRLSIFVSTAAFIGFLGWAASYNHSHQIRSTPLFKGVLFTLRQDEQVRKWIGSSIASSNVWGSLNHIKGRANISFDILGSHGISTLLAYCEGKGSVQLVATRFMEDWFVQDLRVVVAGEDIVHIEPGVEHTYKEFNK